MPPEVERRLVAILSADVVGYGRLMAADEQATVRTITAYRNEISNLVGDHRGRVVDATGDNELAEFPTALDAVECAVEIQKVLKVRNEGLTEKRRMVFCIGVHMGDVTVEGERIYGDGVNIAARLEALSEAGGVCVSGAVHEQVRRRTSLQWNDLGEQSVKNIPDTIRVFRLLDEAPVGAKATSTVESDRPSIAVLPFANMSPDPDNEYFSDGLTEEIIADLSKIRAVRVISRTSIMQLKGSDKDVRTIGRQLNVRFLLEGSVRKAGNSLRITAQLIDAEDDVHLWAEKYDGTLDDVFDIQERVSREIVDSLEIELTPHDDRQIAARPISDTRAYEYYLRAKHEISSFTEEGLGRAVDLLLRALEVVGENPLLYSALGIAYCQHVLSHVKLEEQYLRKAEECAGQVFQLAHESAEGHYLLGLTWFARGEAQKAGDAFKRALALDPDHADALLYRSGVLLNAGREATVEVERLFRIDPLTPFNQIALVWGHLVQGRFSEALDACRHWSQIDADNPLASLVLGDVLARNGRGNDARKVLERLARGQPQTIYGQRARFLVHALTRERDETLEAVTPALTESARWDFQTSWELATGFALINEKEEALVWLECAMRRGFINYPFFSKHDPLLENLREEKGFLRLMEEVKTRWESFEV